MTPLWQKLAICGYLMGFWGSLRYSTAVRGDAAKPQVQISRLGSSRHSRNAVPDRSARAEQDDFHPIPRWIVALRLQAAAATRSNDTPVSAAETSQSRAATATSFACDMIFAGTGGPFSS